MPMQRHSATASRRASQLVTAMQSRSPFRVPRHRHSVFPVKNAFPDSQRDRRSLHHSMSTIYQKIGISLTRVPTGSGQNLPRLFLGSSKKKGAVQRRRSERR